MPKFVRESRDVATDPEEAEVRRSSRESRPNIKWKGDEKNWYLSSS